MKKAFIALTVFTTAIISLPLAGVLFEAFGYTFELRHHSCFVIITGLSALSTVFLVRIFKPDKQFGVLFALLPLLSVFNAFYYIWNINGNAALVFISSLVCICSSFHLTLEFGKSGLKVVMITVSTAVIVGLTGIGGIVHLFRVTTEGLNYVTVNSAIESPDGKYVAEIIKLDSGAMGGATRVEVRKKNGGVDAFVFKMSKKPTLLWSGDWHESPRVHWENESCVIVNSIQHEID